MTEETPPPTPLPPAAQPPYPIEPAPHGATRNIPVAQPPTQAPPGVGALGVTLIGGAVAATIGLLVAIPFFKRRKAAAPPSRRRTAKAPKAD